MANWTGSSMVAGAQAMLRIIENMDNLNRTLMTNVASYATAMQDNVKEGTEEMIKKIDTLLLQIRKEVEEKAQKVNEAGEKLSALELAAKGKIDSFR